jgi:hypothetical protein
MVSSSPWRGIALTIKAAFTKAQGSGKRGPLSDREWKPLEEIGTDSHALLPTVTIYKAIPVTRNSKEIAYSKPKLIFFFPVYVVYKRGEFYIEYRFTISNTRTAFLLKSNYTRGIRNSIFQYRL